MQTPFIVLDESELTLETAKAHALLYYLAITKQPHSRARLVDLLLLERLMASNMG